MSIQIVENTPASGMSYAAIAKPHQQPQNAAAQHLPEKGYCAIPECGLLLVGPEKRICDCCRIDQLVDTFEQRFYSGSEPVQVVTDADYYPLPGVAVLVTPPLSPMGGTFCQYHHTGLSNAPYHSHKGS